MKKGMISRLYDSLALMVIRTRMAVSDLRENEEAMEVIQVVMLIAVGVLAIAAVWAGVNGLLEKWWTLITNPSNTKTGPNLN